MRYETTARDFFYETSGVTALTYYITFNNTPIYWGAAAKSPNEPNLRINIGRRVSDYLHTSMPDFRGFDGVVIAHPEQMGWFNLYDTEGNLLEEFCVVYEFSGDFRWENCSMNEPINGHADMRQKIIISRESVSADTFEINGGNLEISFSDGFFYDYESGTRAVGVTANTVFTAETSTSWIQNLNVSLNTNPDGVTGTISFDVTENQGDVDRFGEIDIVRRDVSGGECTLPTVVVPITVTQEWNWLGDGEFGFCDDYFPGEAYSNVVQMYAGVPYYNRSYAVVGVPQGGRTSKVRFATGIPVLNVTIEKNGTVIGTEQINPTMEWQPPLPGIGVTGSSDIYEYTFSANNGDTADEYKITFTDLNGNTKGTIYCVQPPVVPSQYDARNVISGSGAFNYYLTAGDVKNYWATGEYYSTDAEAIADGYPRKGGYPTSSVYNLRDGSTNIYGEQTIIYLQSANASGFLFGNGSAFSGLSAPNVQIVSDETGTGTFKWFREGVKTIEFMDMPRCLVLGLNLTGAGVDIYNPKTINELNVWSLTFLFAGALLNTKGLKTLYLPNICCIEENNFYDAPDLTDVYLGTTLRFFGIKDIHQGQGGGSASLPSNISFHYLGTKQMFQEKVLYRPRGMYHCTDGDLWVTTNKQ